MNMTIEGIEEKQRKLGESQERASRILDELKGKDHSVQALVEYHSEASGLLAQVKRVTGSLAAELADYEGKLRPLQADAARSGLEG